MIARSAAWLLAALLPLMACTRPSTPTGPSPTGPRTGTWSGSITDSLNGTGTIRVVLQDLSVDNVRSLLTGTWTTTFADAAKNASGSLSGTATGSSGTLSLVPTRPPECSRPIAFPGAVGSYIVPALNVSANQMTGAYVLATCDGSVAGTLDLRR
jgi:hypothetical protein